MKPERIALGHPALVPTKGQHCGYWVEVFSGHASLIAKQISDLYPHSRITFATLGHKEERNPSNLVQCLTVKSSDMGWVPVLFSCVSMEHAMARVA